MKLDVEIKGLPDLEKRFDPVLARQKLREGVFRGLIAVGNSTRRKLSGPVLKNQTGTLRRSIHERLEEAAEYVKGLVGSFAGYPNPKGGAEAAGYARIHEFGGTFHVPEHERRVSKVFGREVEPFMQRVRAYSVTYPERSFLRSSLKDEKKNVVKELRISMLEALRGQ